MITYETVVVAIAALLYISVGVSYAAKGNFPWAIVWLAYGLANSGLIWAALVAPNK